KGRRVVRLPYRTRAKPHSIQLAQQEPIDRILLRIENRRNGNEYRNEHSECYGADSRLPGGRSWILLWRDTHSEPCSEAIASTLCTKSVSRSWASAYSPIPAARRCGSRCNASHVARYVSQFSLN